MGSRGIGEWYNASCTSSLTEYVWVVHSQQLQCDVVACHKLDLRLVGRPCESKYAGVHLDVLLSLLEMLAIVLKVHSDDPL